MATKAYQERREIRRICFSLGPRARICWARACPRHPRLLSSRVALSGFRHAFLSARGVRSTDDNSFLIHFGGGPFRADDRFFLRLFAAKEFFVLLLRGEFAVRYVSDHHAELHLRVLGFVLFTVPTEPHTRALLPDRQGFDGCTLPIHTSRELNEEKRPNTCSRPCAFEEINMRKKKARNTGQFFNE